MLFHRRTKASALLGDLVSGNALNLLGQFLAPRDGLGARQAELLVQR
ncbi:hypothetical protein HA397_26935, partial [Escherichia coli]|nr:hypothetical protein [Escherichia coli]